MKPAAIGQVTVSCGKTAYGLAWLKLKVNSGPRLRSLTQVNLACALFACSDILSRLFYTPDRGFAAAEKPLSLSDAADIQDIREGGPFRVVCLKEVITTMWPDTDSLVRWVCQALNRLQNHNQINQPGQPAAGCDLVDNFVTVSRQTFAFT